MKLATMHDGTRDGQVVVVSKDHKRAVAATPVASNLQEALERWTQVAVGLETLALALESGNATGAFDFTPEHAMAPLPRAWQWLDGSAFASHGDLMEKVFKMDPIPKGRPLMYQGVSDTFYSATQPVPFLRTEDGIDFEGEFGVIVDEVPAGCTAEEAGKHIRLLVQINDWSLRVLAPIEMKTGFGWVQAKPPCSVAPVAVTPDELGAAWKNSRVHLPLHVSWNGKQFGAAMGDQMSFGFDELVAYAAATRRLVAGTVIGSGTVSNGNFRQVGSSCIAEKRGIELMDEGKASTPYMKFGDRVRMEARDLEDQPLFGIINQEVVQLLRGSRE